jgi:hypothetical protein
LFVLPGKDRLLEATEEASQVYIEEHRRMAYLASLAELKEVIFEELVAFHRATSIKIGTAQTTAGRLKPALLNNIDIFMVMGECDKT